MDNLQLSNSFAALEVRKAKKKKQLDPAERKRRGEAKTEQNLRLEQAIFAKRESNVSDWADDEEDGWGPDPSRNVMDSTVNGKDTHLDLHESEEEIDLEAHFGVELDPEDDREEHEDKEKQEITGEPSTEELALLEEHRKKYQVQPQRKVSKKALKKKEMEDLDDMLADLGIEVNECQKGTADSATKKKKKKNKDKQSSTAIQGEVVSEKIEATPKTETSTETASAEPAGEEITEESSALTPEQIRNKLEKLKGAKKRSSSKKSVEIAAAEAKARSKGKKGKKDASHYNQAPNH